MAKYQAQTYLLVKRDKLYPIEFANEEQSMWDNQANEEQSMWDNQANEEQSMCDNQTKPQIIEIVNDEEAAMIIMPNNVRRKRQAALIENTCNIILVFNLFLYGWSRVCLE